VQLHSSAKAVYLCQTGFMDGDLAPLSCQDAQHVLVRKGVDLLIMPVGNLISATRAQWRESHLWYVYRAERIEKDAADIRIYSITDPRVTVALAQLKASANRGYLRRLNKSIYSGLLKIVPSGYEVVTSGRVAALSHGGVASVPASLRAMETAVADPQGHFCALLGKAG
jgi:hypothetical protein